MISNWNLSREEEKRKKNQNRINIIWFGILFINNIKYKESFCYNQVKLNIVVIWFCCFFRDLEERERESENWLRAILLFIRSLLLSFIGIIIVCEYYYLLLIASKRRIFDISIIILYYIAISLGSLFVDYFKSEKSTTRK